MTTQSPPVASQDASHHQGPTMTQSPSLPKPDIGPTDDEFGYTADQMNAHGLARYEAGRAAAAQAVPEGFVLVPQTERYYLWEHPTLAPRVARVTDAGFTHGDPQWVRCYPVEVQAPVTSVGAEEAEQRRRNADTARHDLLIAIFERHDVAATFFAFDRMAVGKDRDSARNALCEYDRSLNTKIDNLMALSALAAPTQGAEGAAPQTSVGPLIPGGWKQAVIEREGSTWLDITSPAGDMIQLPWTVGTIGGEIMREFGKALAAAPAPQAVVEESQARASMTRISGVSADVLRRAALANPVPALAQAVVRAASEAVGAQIEALTALADTYVDAGITYQGNPNALTVAAFDTARSAFINAISAALTSTAPQEADALREALKDTERLDWLERQSKAYGYADVHEGNVWEIGGAYRSVRDAIDHESAALAQHQPATLGDTK